MQLMRNAYTFEILLMYTPSPFPHPNPAPRRREVALAAISVLNPIH